MTNPHFLSYIKKDSSSEEIMMNFFTAIGDLGITPYPAQEEAIFELFSEKNVILSTPTGSGKSLVATAAHYKGFCENKRSFYTCPIKALVSEKFFALCESFGAENVGMLTGDASINRDASIICCTAEILANLALSEREKAKVDYVIMDEFHYYSDPERGVAWQVPLLCLPQSTFLLMSATIGPADVIKQTLKDITKKEVAEISGLVRPVPLHFSYKETPLHETLAESISLRRYPIYVVNFTQKECADEAQNAMSVNICTKEEKQKIDEAIYGFSFDTPFGKEVKKFIRHGVGIHHAGLLPKYRLLVEKLAQSGLLKIIMGTDTLGVGVNVPIKTVLFTKLYKFDGQKTGILSIRDFKQIAGRAGRKGFDEEGFVLAQAPEHVIENIRAENKISLDKSKKKKIVKKEPPKNYVHFDEKTFNKLINDPPETLTSKFIVNHSMILQALSLYEQNGNQGYRNLINTINICHENKKEKSKLRKKTAQLFKSLLNAQIFSIVKNIIHGSRIVANESLQQDFSLHHALSLYAVEAISVLNIDHEQYALDVLSIMEAILENPKAILLRQVEEAKKEAMAKMKAEGIEFEERIEKLDKIEYDKPLAEFIYQTYNEFKSKHPWLSEENIHPKSIVRAMFLGGVTFNEYVNFLQIARSEGLLLRYLSQAYKALVQTVPEKNRNEPLMDIIAYIGTMLSYVDTSLIEEWEGMFKEKEQKDNKNTEEKIDEKAIKTKIRAEVFNFIRLLANKNYEEAKKTVYFDGDLEESFKLFYENYNYIIADHRARDINLFKIASKDHEFNITYSLLDDREEKDCYLEFSYNIKKEKEYPQIVLQSIRL